MQQKTKLSQNTKALHPISIVILIIALIITIAGITYLYLTMQTRAGNTIQIQSVTFQQSTTTIYVQNTGQATVNIKTIQINNQQHPITPANCTVNTQNTTTIPQGATAQITINKAYTATVHIKAICQDGTSYEADYKP
jgi:P pilus assembly chaperone PapD